MDQRLTVRGRTGRLIAALARYPYLLGVGIDVDTALIAEGDEFQVVGAGAVTAIDLGAATANTDLELAAGGRHSPRRVPVPADGPAPRAPDTAAHAPRRRR